MMSETRGTSAALASAKENNLDKLKINVLYSNQQGGKIMKSKSVVKLTSKKLVKLESLKEFAAIPKELKKAGLNIKDFKAAVVAGKDGSPEYFVFDTYSLWDLLCVFDEKFEAEVSSKKYLFHNPVGWLIDAIEARLPVNPKLALKLKKGIEEAEKLGLVSFEKIKHKLGLS